MALLMLGGCVTPSTSACSPAEEAMGVLLEVMLTGLASVRDEWSAHTGAYPEGHVWPEAGGTVCMYDPLPQTAQTVAPVAVAKAPAPQDRQVLAAAADAKLPVAQAPQALAPADEA